MSNEKKSCPSCGGHGRQWDNRANCWITCGRCGGQGYVLASNPRGISRHDKD